MASLKDSGSEVTESQRPSNASLLLKHDPQVPQSPPCDEENVNFENIFQSLATAENKIRSAEFPRLLKYYLNTTLYTSYACKLLLWSW